MNKKISVKKGLTVEGIWDQIVDTNPKPRPVKSVLVEVMDKINEVAGNKCVDEIINEMALGEVDFKNIPKYLSTSGKEHIYDNYTARKKVLFPNVPDVVSRLTQIGKIYYFQRFIMEHGLPPYGFDKINLPERKVVKRSKSKVKHKCPNCGYLLTGMS